MNEMNEKPLDDRRDRLVSALYGELDESELRAFNTEIAEDAELKTQWSELRAVRQLIRDAEAERMDEAAPQAAPAKTHPIRQLLATLSSSRLAASGFGFAAAATLFVALLVGGLRIDRTPEGLLIRLDGSLASDLAVASGEIGGNAGWGGAGVSHAEMAELTRALAGATGARLDELERRQVESQAGMTQALYDAILINQQQQYADLRNRIERVAYTAGATPPMARGASAARFIEGGTIDDN